MASFIPPLATTAPRPVYNSPPRRPTTSRLLQSVDKAVKNNHLGLALNLLNDNPRVALPPPTLELLAGKLRTRGLRARADLLSKQHGADAALHLLSVRRSNPPKLTLAIRNLADKGSLDAAVQLVKNTHTVNIPILELLLKQAACDAHVRNASYILEVLFPKFAFLPTALAYRYFVDACGKAGNIPRAMTAVLMPHFALLSIHDQSTVFPRLIDACVRCRRMDLANTVLRQMRSSAIPRSDAIYESLLSGATRCAPLHSSLNILRDMANDGFALRKISTYNAMIVGFARVGYLRDAITVYHTMLSSNVPPNRETYNALLKCCARAVKPDKAFEVLEWMRNEPTIRPNAVSYNWIVAACARAGDVDTAFQVAYQMQREGIKLNIVTNNNLLEACCNAGRLEQAYAMVKEMIQNDVHPNSHTYNALIRGCGRWGQLDAALRILRSMRTAGVSPTVITYSVAVDACARAGGTVAVDQAFELVREMQTVGLEPNLVTYNSLIHACARAKRADKAFQVFEEMNNVAIAPDIVTLCSLVDACGRSGEVHRAFGALRDLPNQFASLRPNVPAYNALIHACFRAGDLGRMHEALEDMKGRNLRPNVVTYSTLISAYSASGDIEKAVSCLEEMRRMKIRPNRMTFTSIIAGYGHLGKVDLAMDMLDYAKKYCGDPDEELYTSAIVAAIVGGRKELAVNIAGDMNRAGYSVPTVLNSMMRKVGDVERTAAELRNMLSAMKALGIRPQRAALESLIGAYAREADVASAFAVLPEMRQLGYSPNLRTYKQLIQACALRGSKSDIRKARALFRKLRSALQEYEPRLLSHHWKDLYEALIRALEKAPYTKDGVDLRIAALRSMADDCGEEHAGDFAKLACPELVGKY